VPPLFWSLGTIPLLFTPVARMAGSRAFDAISPPRTPVDHVNGTYARQWALLQAARELVPAGASYTALAADKGDEMLLLMLSLGLYTDRYPLASSYWTSPVADGALARYVIAYDCPDPSGATLTRRFPEGCLWVRPERRP
jgi:hypothetical protein